MTLTPFYAALDTPTRVFVSQQASEIRLLLKTTTRSIIHIGQHLTSVKARLDHGQFADWLKLEFEMSQRTAERWMAVADQFGGKIDNVSNLDKIALSALYQLAEPSTPDEVRDAMLDRAAAGESVTSTDVRAATAESLFDRARAFEEQVVILLDKCEEGSLTYTQLRDRLGVSLNDKSATAALRAALDTLYGRMRIQKDKSGLISILKLTQQAEDSDALADLLVFGQHITKPALRETSGLPAARFEIACNLLLAEEKLVMHSGLGLALAVTLGQPGYDEVAADAEALRQRYAGSRPLLSEIGPEVKWSYPRVCFALDLLYRDHRAQPLGTSVRFAPLPKPTPETAAPPERTASVAEQHVRFDSSLITIASPDKSDLLDPGSWDRAVEVGGFLVLNGKWDGQSPVTINNPYMLHSRVFGLDHAPASSVVAGTDYVLASSAAPTAAADPAHPDVPASDQIAWIAGELPIRQREMLIAVAVGQPVVKNAATRIALINRKLLTSGKPGAVGYDWWKEIEMTDKGRAVAEYLLKSDPSQSTSTPPAPAPAEAYEKLEPLRRAMDILKENITLAPPVLSAPALPISVSTAKEMIIDALRQSNRALGFSELRKFAGIDGEAPGLFKQAVLTMLDTGSLAVYDHPGVGCRYHFPHMVARLKIEHGSTLAALSHREFVVGLGERLQDLRDWLTHPYAPGSLDTMQIDGTRGQIAEARACLEEISRRLAALDNDLAACEIFGGDDEPPAAGESPAPIPSEQPDQKGTLS